MIENKKTKWVKKPFLYNLWYRIFILPTNWCFIYQKVFSVSELLLRYSNLASKKYIYYHPTCLHYINMRKFCLIWYDRCKNSFIESDVSRNKQSKEECFEKIDSHQWFSSYLPVAYEIIFISFRLNKCSIHNYWPINGENHYGGCFYQDIIDTGRLNDNVCSSTIEHGGD